MIMAKSKPAVKKAVVKKAVVKKAAPVKKLAKKVPAKKAVKKAVKKAAPSLFTPVVNKFASKSCRKGKAGFDFKGKLADGFVVATTGSTKEKAALAAQVTLDLLCLYKDHQRTVENTRRRDYRNKKKPAVKK
jgi:hypothetical protein